MSKHHDKQKRPVCPKCGGLMARHCENAGCDSWVCEHEDVIIAKAPGRDATTIAKASK